jgi:hypothetical protein
MEREYIKVDFRRKNSMSCFREKFTIENHKDLLGVEFGLMQDSEVHRLVQQEALVDSGAWTLVIGEETAKKLGLEHDYDEVSEVAGGEEVEGWMAKPSVVVRYCQWKAVLDAFVIPGSEDVIVGALPLEIMDLWINPRRERLERQDSKRVVK